ncbi:hypothetical protein Lesp02_54850 [Lentzea sp. NBRC 105346]|uniref:hypothetical protein n=1 Tax=Lentzea sp. NBRC 105346 TaxID=3032205 RepID=UPI0024A18938|nr:hypothetical protein [Lentzea sp. NBRC 105346]GLZ33297.1 hypothetical protein Lesp02_54850 [Lentzea sp. NBRC 105346]
MSLHAFVDESRRNSTYLLAAALVEPRQLSHLRKLLMGLRMPNQRELHFKKETPARRRLIVSRLIDADVRTDLYVACCRRGEEKARQRCVTRLTDDLLDVRAHRLVMDSREVRDEHDQLTIRLALGKRARETGLVYEHLASENDPLLWIPDIVAWCYGAGDDWLRRIKPTVRNVIDLREP